MNPTFTLSGGNQPVSPEAYAELLKIVAQGRSGRKS